MTPAKTPDPKTAPSLEAGEPSAVESDVMEVSTTAIANARTGTLNATQSAIGSAAVEGDALLSASAVGMVSAKRAASLHQGVAGAVVSEGDIAVQQGGGAVMVGRTIDVDQGGSGVMVSGETNASRSYVGVLVSRRASFSEDSRVLFDWKAALILAAVLVGGVGLIIIVAVVLAKILMGRIHRVAERLPHLSVPHLSLPHLPEVPPWVAAVARRIRAA